MTVSAWIKHAGSPGDFSYVVAKGANGCIAASYGLYSGSDGGLEFYVSQGHGSVYARSPDAGQRVWDGNWHLAVGTYDGSTIRLYVDGVEVGTGTPWPGSLEYLLPNSNDFYIGNYPGCADHEFLGAIDDVMVWNRTLGAAEIDGLLPSGDTPPSQPTSPSGGGGTQGRRWHDDHRRQRRRDRNDEQAHRPRALDPWREAVGPDRHGRHARSRDLAGLVRTVAHLHRVGGRQPDGDTAALREGRTAGPALRRTLRPSPRSQLHAFRRDLERHAHRPGGPPHRASQPVAASPSEPGHLPTRRDPAGAGQGRQDGERALRRRAGHTRAGSRRHAAGAPAIPPRRGGRWRPQARLDDDHRRRRRGHAMAQGGLEVGAEPLARCSPRSRTSARARRNPGRRGRRRTARRRPAPGRSAASRSRRRRRGPP